MIRVLAVALAAAWLAGCREAPAPARAVQLGGPDRPCLATTVPAPAPATHGMVLVKGGRFLQGARPARAEEGPPRETSVGSFWIDRTEVTNADFARFVAATGYVTQAERPLDPKAYPGLSGDQLKPSAIVFVGATAPAGSDPGQWWRVVQGADWRHPQGPRSSIAGKESHPVVQITYADALAYARWLGRDLPTEAEWEYAARGGLADAAYAWGDARYDKKQPQANIWDGPFPAVDSGSDGYKARTAPVGCFRANGYGLYDMAGNVWEWTRDWYRPNLDPADAADPVGPTERAAFAGDAERHHVIKGGSFLCADNFCFRYRPPAREAGPTDTGSDHVGFRTVLRVKPAAKVATLEPPRRDAPPATCTTPLPPGPAGGWRRVAEAPTADATLRAVAIAGPRMAASGSKGTVVVSEDGGRTWRRATTPGGEALDIRGVALAGGKTLIAMSAGPAEQGQARLYRSEDMGRTWTLAFETREAGVFFDTVAFRDGRDGLVLSDPVGGRWRLLRTRDGGQTWAWAEAEGAAPAAAEAAFAASNSALAAGPGGQVWIVSGGSPHGRVFRSPDFGATWTVSETPIAGGATGGVFGALALPGGRGVVVGGDHKDELRPGVAIAVTADAGLTWTAAQGATPRLLEGVARKDARTLVAVGPRGTALSGDLGRTWRDVDVEAFHAVACDRGRCVAAGPKGRIAVWGQ